MSQLFTFQRSQVQLGLLSLILFFVVSLNGFEAKAQTSYTDCTGTNTCTDPTNSGVAASGAATLSYDNVISAWHASTTNTSSDGSVHVWGQNSSATGGDLLSPTAVNAANGYDYGNAVPVKVAVGSVITQSGSNFNYPHQFILLTDDNSLWTWGGGGAVLSTTLASGNNFQKVTPGNSGSNSSLPAGVNAGDVKMMFATTGTLAITTCDGAVWVLSQNANIRQGGSATSWVRINKSNNNNGSTNNGPLTDIIATRGTPAGLFALDANGDIWTWGYNTRLGNGSASAHRTYATKMTLPGGSGDIKMIGATTQRSSYDTYTVTYTGTGNTHISNWGISYYVLYEDGKLYSMGANTGHQLGNMNTGAGTNPSSSRGTAGTDQNSWVRPHSSFTQRDNIAWISPQEHDFMFGFINVITKDSVIYNWGDESGAHMGRLSDGYGDGSVGNYAHLNPGTPNNWQTGRANSEILAVESGGHTTVLLRKCENTFGYIGHRTNGSMGDRSDANETDNQVKFNTNAINVCGIPTTDAELNIAQSSNNNRYCKNNPIEFEGTPAGGTYRIDGNAYGATINSSTGVLDANSMTFGGGQTRILRVMYEIPAGEECAGAEVQSVITIENCISSIINIPGSIWNDENSNAQKDNGETNVQNSGMWANLVGPNGRIIAYAQILADGTYNIQVSNEDLQNAGDYSVILTSTKRTVGNILSTGATLTDNQIYTGTNRGQSGGVTQDPNTSNTSGILNIGDLSAYATSPTNVSIDSANYGITVSQLDISKVSDVEEGYTEGDVITYTIVVKNNDNATHTNVSVTDNLPAGVTYVPGSVEASVGNPNTFQEVTQALTGSGTFNVPSGVTQLVVETWGAGGKGGNMTGTGYSGGGGGGAYSREVITVSQSTYYYSVGSGSTNANPGGDSWFATTNSSFNAIVLAKGGNSVSNNGTVGASGGSASAGIGGVKYSGGNGGSYSGGTNAGGGGSSAGIGSNGTNGTLPTGGVAPQGGGDGGNGATGTGNQNGNGQAGLNPGGGGGGSGRNRSGTRTGGNGANGQIVVSYLESVVIPDGDTGNPPLLASGWTVQSGDSLTVTFQVTVDSPSSVDSIKNIASATSNFVTEPIKDSITDYPKNTTFAVNDENSTWINTPVSGDVMTNDFDLEGDAIEFGTFLNQDGSGDPVALDGNGEFQVSGFDMDGNPVANAGKIKPDGNGGYTYTPAEDFTGNISVPYAMNDKNNPAGVARDSAVLDITVSPLPSSGENSVIANNDEYYTHDDVPVSGNWLTNDADPQGDSFEITEWTYLDEDGVEQTTTTLPTSTPITVSGIDEHGDIVVAGTIVLDKNGNFTFTPEEGFEGEVPMTYEITDDYTKDPATDKAKVVITVVTDKNGPKNDPPVAGDDFSYTKINTPVDGDFVNNDSDPNDDPISMKDDNDNPVTIDPTKDPKDKAPIKTVTTEKGGELTFYDDGSYTYTPPTDYVGPDRVVYEICDVTEVEPQPLCAKATVHLLVGDEINSTYAVNDENSTWINTPVSGDVMTNDFDLEGDAIEFGTFLNQDGSGNPVTLDGNGEFPVSGYDLDGNFVADAGTIKPDGNGGYTYTPAEDFTGNISVPYAMNDKNNPAGVARDTAVLDITVSPLANEDNSVIANNDEYHTQGNPVNGNWLTNDADPQGDDFEITEWTYLDENGVERTTTTLPSSPVTVSGIDEKGNTVVAGTIVLDKNGNFTFVPEPGFAGEVPMSYEITDDVESPLTATDRADVLITVIGQRLDDRRPKNDPPFPGDDFSYTTINEPVDGNFIGNDDEPNDDPVSMKDDQGNPITIDPTKNPQDKSPIKTVETEEGGEVTFYDDGSYTYNPPTDYVGPDRVVYEICDVTEVEPQPLCAKATVHLLVGDGFTVTGTLYNDGNGMTDNQVNGSVTNVDGVTYAVLTDTLGNVLQSTPIKSDGTFEFKGVPAGKDLLVLMDTMPRNKGEVVTESTLPEGYVSTGEIIGLISGEDGDIDGKSADFRTRVDKHHVNFGINRLPIADEKLYVLDHTSFTEGAPEGYPDLSTEGERFFYIPTSSPSLTGYTYDGLLTGKDAEDCAATESCNEGKTFKVNDILSTTELYYDFGGETGVQQIVSGTVIPNYDADKLIIYGREGAGQGDTTGGILSGNPIGFEYSLVDEAGFASESVPYIILTDNALPVELLYFVAQANACEVELSWATASELNNDYFEVQTSTDARQWKSLGQVQGGGNSNIPLYYDYVDAQASSGLNYYRLKQVDFNGDVEYHKIASVQVTACDAASISIYPNPTQAQLNVQLNVSRLDEVKLSVIDVSGRVLRVLNTVTSSLEQLEVSSLPSGTYFLRADMSGKVETLPFVITR